MKSACLITCLRFRRALAEYATSDRALPVGGSLARHLAVCTECSRELDWLRAAHRGLEESLSADQTSAGFLDLTWARFTASHQAPPRRSLATVFGISSAACATAIAAATIIILRSPQTPTQFDAPGRTAPAFTQIAENDGTGQVDMKTKPGKPATNTVSTDTEIEAKPSNKPAPIRHRRVRYRHVNLMVAHLKPIKAGGETRLVSASKTHSAGMQTVSLDQIASWYEYQGDYRSAAAAYAQAARERPTDSLVFNAGRASECAGDVAQAIVYYARVLKHEREQEAQPKQDSQPKKGTWRWNANRDSA